MQDTMLPRHRYSDTALCFVYVLGNGDIDNYALTDRKYSQKIMYSKFVDNLILTS